MANKINVVDLWNQIQAQKIAAGQPAMPQINKVLLSRPVDNSASTNDTVSFLRKARTANAPKNAPTVDDPRITDPIEAQKQTNRNTAARLGISPDLPMTPEEELAAAAKVDTPKPSYSKSGPKAGFDAVDAISSFFSSAAHGIDNGAQWLADGMADLQGPMNELGSLVMTPIDYVAQDPYWGSYRKPWEDPWNWGEYKNLANLIVTGVNDSITGDTKTQGANIVQHTTGHLLDEDENDAPWQAIAKDIARPVLATAADIGLNPASWMGVGAVAELTEAPPLFIKGARVYDTLLGNKTAKKVSFGKTFYDELRNTGATKLTSARMRKAADATGEGGVRMAGGLAGKKSLTNEERENIVSAIVAEHHDFNDRIIQKELNSSKKFPKVFAASKAQRSEGFQYIQARVEAAKTALIEKALTPGPYGTLMYSKLDIDKALAQVEKEARREWMVASNNTLAKQARALLEERANKGAFQLRLGPTAAAVTGRKNIEFGRDFYEKSQKAKKNLLSKRDIKYPFIPGIHLNPVEAINRGFNNGRDFYGRLNLLRQEAMSGGLKAVQGRKRKLQSLGYSVSRENERAIRNATERGKVVTGYTPKGIPLAEVQEKYIAFLREDLFDYETKMGLRDPDRSRYDPTYIPLDLRSTDREAVKKFLAGRRDEIQREVKPSARKYTYDAAVKQGLKPVDGLFQPTMSRVAKTQSKINRGGFSALLIRDHGYFGNLSAEEARSMGRRQVDAKTEKFYRGISKDTTDGMKHLPKSKHIYLPEHLADAHKQIDKMMDVYDPYEMKAFLKFVDHAQRQWKFLQTVPRIGAQSRNAQSDILTGWLDHIGPTAYTRESRNLGKYRRGETPLAVKAHAKDMEVEVPWGDVEQHFERHSDIGGSSSEFTRIPGQEIISKRVAANAAHVGKEKLIDLADKREKFFRRAHFHEAFKQELQARLNKYADSGYSQLTVAARENMVRDSLYAAQNRVNKFHVDYSNLTPFELYARRPFPFYTYLRGITPTLMATSIANPGRMNAWNSALKNLPMLFGMPMNPDDRGYDPIIPGFRTDFNGIQMTDERNPLYYGNRSNVFNTTADLTGGDIPQNIYSKLSPLAVFGMEMMTKHDSLGRPIKGGTGGVLANLIPGKGQGVGERLKSFVAPEGAGIEDIASFLGVDLTRITDDQQVSELKSRNQGPSTEVAAKNAELLKKGLRVSKTPGKQQWTIQRVNPTTERRIPDTKAIGPFTDPGDAQKYAEMLTRG